MKEKEKKRIGIILITLIILFLLLLLQPILGYNLPNYVAQNINMIGKVLKTLIIGIIIYTIIKLPLPIQLKVAVTLILGFIIYWQWKDILNKKNEEIKQ